MKTEEEEKQKETPNSLPGIMRKAFIGSIILCVISGSTYFISEQMWLFSISITFGTIAFHLGIRYLSPVILYLLFHKKYNYENGWFRQKSWEPGLYQFLRVKTWKSRILSYNANEFSMKKHSLEEIQVRHRRTCREARAPKELSSVRLCDPPEAQLSAGDCHPLLKRICYPPLSALRT